MRLALTLVATAVLALIAPVAASGATLAVTPDKPCYGHLPGGRLHPRGDRGLHSGRHADPDPR